MEKNPTLPIGPLLLARCGGSYKGVASLKVKLKMIGFCTTMRGVVALFIRARCEVAVVVYGERPIRRTRLNTRLRSKRGDAGDR